MKFSFLSFPFKYRTRTLLSIFFLSILEFAHRNKGYGFLRNCLDSVSDKFSTSSKDPASYAQIRQWAKSPWSDHREKSEEKLTLNTPVFLKCWPRIWRNWNSVHCWWDCKMVQLLRKTVWNFLKKLKIELHYDPYILLWIYSHNNWKQDLEEIFSCACS